MKLAEFKCRMQVGTFWVATHETKLTKDVIHLRTRKCVLHNSVDFGFETVTKSTSHCSWPKASQLSMDGETIVIESLYHILRYTPVNVSEGTEGDVHNV